MIHLVISVFSCRRIGRVRRVCRGHRRSARKDATFSKDIAPIFERACQNCHRPGSIAPMSLLTYKDARPWARSIKEKVVKRQMPPWHIDRNVGVNKFKDDPSLTDAEVATISTWVDQGSPEGNPADMPAPRQFTDLDKWHMGKPDIVVSMSKPYVLKAKGGDEYYDVEVDPGFTEDVYVQALETKPDLGLTRLCTTAPPIWWKIPKTIRWVCSSMNTRWERTPTFSRTIPAA